MHPDGQRVIDECFQLHFDSTVRDFADAGNAHFNVRFEAGNRVGFALLKEHPNRNTRSQQQHCNYNPLERFPFLHGVHWLIAFVSKKAFPPLLRPCHTYMCMKLFKHSPAAALNAVLDFGMDFYGECVNKMAVAIHFNKTTNH